jgi:hypothetical protein
MFGNGFGTGREIIRVYVNRIPLVFRLVPTAWFVVVVGSVIRVALGFPFAAAVRLQARATAADFV